MADMTWRGQRIRASQLTCPPCPTPGLKPKPQGPRPNPSPPGVVAWAFSPNPRPNPSPIRSWSVVGHYVGLFWSVTPHSA
ncbi:hypothetical protein Hanom_Chr14g01308631 [Helianthus anomalus]